MRGFVAISTVLIISAVVLIILTTVTMLSINELQSSFGLFSGEDNLTFVEGCVEDYLQKIRASSTYAGGTVTRPEGTCAITITTGNPNWDITVSEQGAVYQRRIQVIFTRSSSGISLTSWKEI